MLPVLATVTLTSVAAVIAIAMLALVMMPKMADPTIPTPQDTSLLLQDTVTKTSSFNSTAFDNGSGFAPGGRGQRASAVVLVTAADFTSTDETYTFKLQESDDNSTFVDAGAAVSVTATGTAVAKGYMTKRYTRLVMTAGGTTPSITYKAWLNPL